MKKLMVLLGMLSCILSLAACNNANQERAEIYAFCGVHEYFTISNGSIFVSDTEEVFYGGELQITQAGIFEDVVSYSASFYTLADGEQRTILSNSVIDQTGGTVHIDGSLGKASGKGVIIGNKVKNMDELRENIWFELKTLDLNGMETIYQIQLTLTG